MHPRCYYYLPEEPPPTTGRKKLVATDQRCPKCDEDTLTVYAYPGGEVHECRLARCAYLMAWKKPTRRPDDAVDAPLR